jgi:hydrogenase maturation protease
MSLDSILIERELMMQSQNEYLDARESAAEWNLRPKLLVLGLGNSILGDGGVGVHAVRRFQRLTPRPCLAIEAGTAVAKAACLLESVDRIVIFVALEAGGEPGSVYVMRAEDILQAGRYEALRETDLFRMLRSVRRSPSDAVIVAAEPQIIDWGSELTPALDSAVSIMVSTAEKIIEQWQAPDSNHGRIDLAEIIRSSKIENQDSRLRLVS